MLHQIIALLQYSSCCCLGLLLLLALRLLLCSPAATHDDVFCHAAPECYYWHTEQPNLLQVMVRILQ
jgi:hypothetical protein